MGRLRSLSIFVVNLVGFMASVAYLTSEAVPSAKHTDKIPSSESVSILAAPNPTIALPSAASSSFNYERHRDYYYNPGCVKTVQECEQLEKESQHTAEISFIFAVFFVGIIVAGFQLKYRIEDKWRNKLDTALL